MITRAGSGHPGGSPSTIDILTVLYFHHMRHDPRDPCWPDRDRFVLSKGHACPALYQEINGHDLAAIAGALERARTVAGRPQVIVARTVKGKGVSFMEGVVGLHRKALTPAELERALAELDGTRAQAGGWTAKAIRLVPPPPRSQPATPTARRW